VRDDGAGQTLRTELDCERGDRERCAEIAELLPELEPREGELCAEVFAGPESISVTGVLDGEQVAVEVDRADACADARYGLLEAALSP